MCYLNLIFVYIQGISLYFTTCKIKLLYKYLWKKFITFYSKMYCIEMEAKLLESILLIKHFYFWKVSSKQYNTNVIELPALSINHITCWIFIDLFMSFVLKEISCLTVDLEHVIYLHPLSWIDYYKLS